MPECTYPECDCSPDAPLDGVCGREHSLQISHIVAYYRYLARGTNTVHKQVWLEAAEWYEWAMNYPILQMPLAITPYERLQEVDKMMHERYPVWF
jgi:hypothetical protein